MPDSTMLRIEVTTDSANWTVEIQDFRWATADGNGVVTKSVTGSRRNAEDERFGRWIERALQAYSGEDSRAQKMRARIAELKEEVDDLKAEVEDLERQQDEEMGWAHE